MLVEEGLAVRGRGSREDGWLGLHPKFAQLYLSVLCNRLSHDRRLTPVTDADHTYASTFAESLDQLLAVHWSEPAPRVAGDDDVRSRLAILALESVLPDDLDNTPIEVIIRLRKKHGDLFHAYRDSVVSLAGDLSGLAGLNPAARDEHLRVTVQAHVAPLVEQLDRAMHDVGLSVTRGTVMQRVRLAVGTGTTIAAPALADVTTATATASVSAAVAVGGFVRGERTRRREALEASPVSYLWSVRRATQPRSAVRKILHTLDRTLGG